MLRVKPTISVGAVDEASAGDPIDTGAERIAACIVINAMRKSATFKGNKSALPTKPCRMCLRDMTWRKAWAKNWHAVLYCSNACRLKAKANAKLDKTTEHLHGL